MKGRQPQRVLIASASAGTGHVSAAVALEAAFADAGCAVRHVDVLELAPRWVRTAYGGGFELLASRAPRLWREVYERSDGPDGDAARWGPIAHRLIFRSFRALLRSEPWDACVCTHFLPGQLAAGLTGHPPFSLVITDFALHRYWVQPRVHDYFVATAELAVGLRERLPAATVSASGIPVAQEYARMVDRRAARALAGLDPDRPVAVVAGGGLGIGVEAAVAGALAAGVDGLQVVAVCGRNAAAHARLEALHEPEERLRVLRYVAGMNMLLAAADVVVTKPGGLTCSEALALGRPLVLTHAIPGHEEANVRYLEAAGAALAAPTPAQVAAALCRLITDDALTRSVTKAARRIGRPRAAHTIAHQVTRRIARRPPALAVA